MRPGLKADEASGVAIQVRKASWKGVRYPVPTPVAASVSRTPPPKSESKSCSKKHFPRKQPSAGSVIWRLRSTTHALSGAETMPPISTRRVPDSATKSRVRPPVQDETARISADNLPAF
jgi:hypothetical protein